MRSVVRAPLLLVLASVSLALLALAAACGGDDDEDGTATRTPAVTGTAAAQPSGTATAAGTPKPSTGEPVDGITDTEIILGSHFAQSGTYGAAFAPVLSGLQAYFEYLNEEKGGVCNREIVLKAEDDQYDPAHAVDVTRKLVEQDKIFAMVAGLGTAAHSAVWEYLNEKEIPDLWVMSGAHKWGADPQGHPWTVGILPDYFVEGTIQGKYISENHPGAKVGILYQNDDFGKDVLAGLKSGLDPAKNELVSEQTYEATAVDVRSQVTNIREKGAEVVVCGCIPGYAAQAIEGADRLGWDPQFIIDYVNSDPIMFQYASPTVMEGVLTLQANKLSTWTDDPAVAQHDEIMKKYGTVAAGNYTMVGQLVGVLMEEVLSRTCDNLTREGLMDAVHSLDNFQTDISLPGVSVTLTPDDHISTEAMRFLRAKLVDGKGVWEYEGELISFR
ncbi:MAG TPA: ABC transporter substrate-binding protein [Dehalococcoidia bacterium]|nr:ABC transporter substrate-binding protein [Dehalococcoidia bacterium]